MKKKKSNKLLLIIAPLIAVAALGASSYLWYKALVPEVERIEIPVPFQVSPDAFSQGLEGNLVAVLEEFGIGKNDIAKKPADDFDDEIRTVYTVTTPVNISLTLINLRVTKMVRDMGGTVLLGHEHPEGRALTLTVGTGKKPTDIIRFMKRPDVVAITARVAVVIDDLGIKSVDLARRLCDLDCEITLAILPFQKHTDDIIDLAEKTGTSYILHMPMEPKSETVNPGKGALVYDDNEESILKKLDRAFASVEGAKGVNNHMGSRVTEDVRIMEHVMAFLRERGYYFLDSQTSRESVGYEISQKASVRGAKISGYIDVQDDRDAIGKRLDILTEYALDNGSAIILGHDRPNTVEVLETKLPEMKNRGIRFVNLTELIK